MSQSVEAPEGITVEALEEFQEVTLFMASGNRTLIQVSPNDICCDICELESPHLGTRSEKWNVDHVSHLPERMAMFTEPSEEWFDD